MSDLSIEVEVGDADLAVLVLIAMSSVDAQVPTAERDALIALYNATNGPGWTNKTGWLGAVGTECDWYGVSCHTSFDNVFSIRLGDNNLSGTIPPELENLSMMRTLSLSDNQLTGSIPAELANNSYLRDLWLSNNQLSGSIPPELGSLSYLWKLILSNNQLAGSIPPDLGNMTAVKSLNLASNQLSGAIPTELSSLSTLLLLDLSYNALYSDNPALVAFLDTKHGGIDWQITQTVAPESPTVGPRPVGDHTVWLKWVPIDYQLHPGGYEVFSSPTGFGVWTSGGWTDSKMIFVFPVTGLDPGTTYDLAVMAFTDPHAFNQNLLNSDLSTLVTATTAGTGCGQPVIEVTGTGPFTLSLTESYDGYNWSTGQTTSSIVVNPSSEQWFGVTVTSAGPCDESAVISVAPIDPLVFSDGFESGDTTGWSNSAP